MNKNLWGLVYAAIALIFINLLLVGVSAIDISNCTKITSAGTYTQTANININGTYSGTNYCIKINVSNVYLDCNNYWIKNLTANENAIGIYNANNVTLLNCNVYAGNDASRYGYYLLNVTNSLFNNNLVQGYDGGFSFWNSTNNTFLSFLSINTARPIQFRGASNNNYLSSIQIVNTSQVGISIGVSPNECSLNNILNDIIVRNSVLSEETTGINVDTCSNNNTLTDANIYDNLGNGIIVNADNTTINNPTISNNTLIGILLNNSNGTIINGGSSIGNGLDNFLSENSSYVLNGFIYTNPSPTPKITDSLSVSILKIMMIVIELIIIVAFIGIFYYNIKENGIGKDTIGNMIMAFIILVLGIILVNAIAEMIT